MSEQLAAVVTGGGSGIGAATVAALARDGFRVAVFDRNGAAAETVRQAAGSQHIACQVDVTDEQAVKQAFAAVQAGFGRLDALVTCAGVVDTTPFFDLTPEMFQRVYAVNVIGTYLAMREAAQIMHQGGRICTIASISGVRGGGFLGTAAYSASKGAILSLTKSSARELAGRGIAVNVVSPGATVTEMTRSGLGDPAVRQRIDSMALMNRSAEPGEIAEAIAWIVSARASFVNGSHLVVDGGLVLL
jgi:NAD(P)-dependent dehydrogenase (short-subunit alcohol dehydrogenase family)